MNLGLWILRGKKAGSDWRLTQQNEGSQSNWARTLRVPINLFIQIISDDGRTELDLTRQINSSQNPIIMGGYQCPSEGLRCRRLCSTILFPWYEWWWSRCLIRGDDGNFLEGRLRMVWRTCDIPQTTNLLRTEWEQRLLGRYICTQR